MTCIYALYCRAYKSGDFCVRHGICGILPFCGLQEIGTCHTGASSAPPTVLKGYCFACFRTLRHTAVLRASRNVQHKCCFACFKEFAVFNRFACFKEFAACSRFACFRVIAETNPERLPCDPRCGSGRFHSIGIRILTSFFISFLCPSFFTSFYGFL